MSCDFQSLSGWAVQREHRSRKMFIHWVYIFYSVVYIVTFVGRSSDVLDLVLLGAAVGMALG